ncbi:MAG: ComEC/Rec2 family competence protein [Clostridia bacterium]|nr:ComEC/Rec2 family competence protein [Clostridia bacterium]
MGRPFAIVGFSMFASLFFMCALGPTAAVVLLAVVLCAFILFIALKKLRRYTALIVSLAAVILAASVYLGVYYTSYVPSQKYMEKEVQISGTLKDYPDYEYDRYYCEIRVHSIAKQSVRPFTLRVSFSDYLEARLGDTLEFKATMHGSGGKGAFTKLNALSKGIYASAYSSNEPHIIKNTAVFKGISYLLAEYRHTIIAALKSVMPPSNASLAAAVLMGEKSYIDSDTLENINTVGISHIICVSGLHLSIFGFALLRLFSHLKVSRKVKYIVCGGCIVFFMALCGFTGSVLRAGIMFLVFIAAELLLAEPDSLNSLGLAASVILLNPFQAGNIGFIFSFMATLAIIVCGSKCTAYLKEKWHITQCAKPKRFLFTLLEIIIISISVNVFCLPFSMLIFQKFSLVSIFANVWILPMASALLISCALCALLALLPIAVFGILIYPAATVASAFCAYVLKVVDILAKIPFSNVYTGGTVLLCACAVVMVLIAVLIFIKRSRVLLRFACAGAIILFIGAFFLQYYLDDTRLQANIFSLKKNVCMSVSAGDDFVLIDAGNSPLVYTKTADSLFRSHSDDVDYFFLCSNAKYQSGKAKQILRRLQVRNLLLPQKTDTSEFEAECAGTKVQSFQYTGFTTKSGMNISFYALKFSAVHISYRGQSILFLSSDKADISVLPEHMQTADYLIIAGKANNLFSKPTTNAIIEISDKTKKEETSNSDTLYSTADSSDIRITITKNGSTIGRVNEWRQ